MRPHSQSEIRNPKSAILQRLVSSLITRRALLAAVFCLAGLGSAVQGQTNPTAQSLPYSQNFGTTTFTTMPTGTAAWSGLSGAGITTQASAEASAPTGDATVTAATTAQSTGGSYGFATTLNGRYYVQTSSNTTSGVNQLAAAVNTTGKTNITVAYDVEIISAQPRTVGVVMQFRVGTSGSWTTVTGTGNPFSQAGGTTGVKASPSLVLPIAAENQPVVQIRWATWRGTESGNSSGVAIDNISITGTSSPTITTSVSSLTDFGSVQVGNTSTEQSYTVSGTNLTDNIVVTAPTDFEVSAVGSGIGFGPSVTVLQAAGIASATIFVRFAPGSTGLKSGNITNASTGATTKNVAVSGTGTAALASEPTVQASNVQFSSVGPSSMTVSWTNGNGASRIVLAKSGSAVSSNPSDGATYTASTTFGSGTQIGTGNFVVFSGSGNSVTVTGLTSSTTYHFAVYEFNGSGGTENYLTTSPAIGNQATTVATYSWIGGSGDWQVATNWSPTRSTPNTTDILQFNGGGTITVTNVPAQTIGQLTVSNSTLVTLQASGANTLTISGGSGTDLSVASGTELNASSANALTIAVATGATGSISGSMTFSGGAHKLTSADASGITFQSGSSFTTGTGFTGNSFGSGTASSVIFASGSTYVFNTGSNPFSLAAPASVVVFQTGSLYKHQSSANAPSVSGRTYANFEYNIAATTSVTGASAMTVDNLTVSQGTYNVNIQGGVNLKGNISVATGATLEFNPASTATLTFNGTTAQSISNSGTLNFQSNQNVTISNSNGVTLNSSITVNGALTLSSGILAVGANTLTLNGAVSATSGSLTSGASGTVNYNQSSNGQNVLAANYGTLIFSNFNKTLASSGTIGITTGFSPGTATGHTVTGSTIEYHLTVGGTIVLPPAFTHYNNLSINELGNTVGPPSLVVDATLHLILGTFTSASTYHDVVIDSGTTLALTGNITVSGNWTNNGTFTPGTNSVTFNGTTNQTIGFGTSNATTFYTLNSANTGIGTVVALGKDATATNAFNVQAGTFSQGSSSNLTTNTVTVSSTTTWQNQGTGDVTLSGNVANSGTITFNGNTAACGENDDILIRSSVPGTQRTWSSTLGTFNMTDVDVKDQAGTAIIIATSSTNSGNNGANWIITSSCTAGNTYTWTGSTDSSWINPLNWSPTRATAATTSTSDILIINTGFTFTITNVPNQSIAALRILNSTDVALNAQLTGAQLDISGGSASDLQIDDASIMRLGGTNPLIVRISSGSTGAVAGEVILQEGAHQLLATGGSSTVTFTGINACATQTNYSASTNPFGTGAGGNGAANSIIFTSGTNYFHHNGASPFGAAGNPSVAVFQTGSTASWLSNNGFQASDRTYADLVIGSSTTLVNVSDSGSGNFQFDNLTVNSTSSSNSTMSYTGSGSSVVTIQSNITSSGTGDGTTASDVSLTAGTNVVLNKAGTQTFSGGNGRRVRFGSNASINNGTTLSLSRNLFMSPATSAGPVLTVNGTLTAGASGYVIGKLKRLFSGAGTKTFEVGTDNGYSPVDVNVTAGSGDLTVLATQGNQPILAPATSLKRYWTLTEGGAITADLTFHYLNDATDVAGNESNYRLVIVESGNATSFPENCPDVACVDESANTIRRTGVTTFSDWTAAEPAAPTAVNLRGFTATRSGDDVSIQWRSGYEVRNLGYNVYREQNGERTLLTPSLVAGSALIAGRESALTAGLSYNWRDRLDSEDGSSKDVTYWLEDVDLNGARTLHGPIAVSDDDEKGRESVAAERSPMINEPLTDAELRQSRGVLLSGGPAQSRGQRSEAGGQKPDVSAVSKIAPLTSSPQQVIAATPGVKLSVSHAGWYRVSQAELVAAGLDPNANVSQLQLFANAQEVPIRISGNGTQLTSADYIEFYGRGIDSPTDNEQPYYLIVGQSNGKRIPKLPGDALGEPIPSSFDYTIERKERFIYFSGLLNGDAENFFGQIVNNRTVSETMEITHLDPNSTNAARLEVSLQGVTAGAHNVEILLNGADVGVMTFANTEHRVQTFSVAAAVLREGLNNVQLTGLGGAGDLSLADTVRLTYAHTYVAESDALAFTVSDGGTTRVTGFSNANVRVIDVTDPANVQELTPAVTQSQVPGLDGSGRIHERGAAGGSRTRGTYMADVRVPSASGAQPHTLYVFADNALAAPDAIKHNNPSNWNANTNSADYLIVTTNDLMSSVAPLATLRQSKGLNVQVIDVEDIFDEFSYGVHSPYAVRDFLQAATSWQGAPHYVLFVGDASYDPKNYFGRGFNDLVPTKLIDTTQMETASDDWLADFNNDGISDLAIGRLPARTAADVALMVNKTIGFENSPVDPTRGALLVADRTFESASTGVQNAMPSGLPTQTINRSSSDDATIHSQILSALNQGPRVANYFGHGSNGVWTSAPLLSSLDAPSLTNSNHLSVFTMMTCFNGYFEDAFNDSLSEALLKSPGGAVAVWASTSLTEPEGQSTIDEEFYRQIFSANAPTLGDAVRTAKQASTDGDVRRTWILFGDPAMRMNGATSTPNNPRRRR